MGKMVRALLCLSLLSVVALSGCASGDETTDPTASTTSRQGGGVTTTRGGGGGGGGGGGITTTTTGGGGGGGGSGNHPPTGSIAASITQGQVPVLVEFTLEGSDQDGDSLSWNLDFDGDGQTDKSGSALPSTETYNYTTPGTYNVTFVISDGEASTTYTQAIDAAAAAGGSGPKQVVDGGFNSGVGAGCSPVGGYFNDLAGVFDHDSFEPDAVTVNTRFVITYSAAAAPLEYVLQFWNDNSSITAEYRSGTATIEGTVPDPTDSVIVSACGGAGITFHYEAGLPPA